MGALGGVGAILRFLLDGSVSARLITDFPIGTLAVNLAGALTLGLLVGFGLDGSDLRLTGVGLLGSFTTFSTWMIESERLSEDGAIAAGLGNLLISLALGFLLAWVGVRVGEVL